MKILMLNYEFPPLGGGAGRAMQNILRQWCGREGLRIHVVTSALGEAGTEQMAPNIRLHFLDIGKRSAVHHQSARDLLAYSWRAWRCGRRLMGEIEFDLCHAFFGIPCGVIARQLGLPYIVSLRGSDVPFYSERFRVADRLVFRWLSRRVWRGASAVVANSRGLRRLALRTAPQEDIEVIPNGVDTDLFHPDGASEGPLKVLCVARLIPRKRVDLLIRAVAALEEDVRLTVVGEGPEEAHLRRVVSREGLEERVRLEGYVPHEDLPELYRAHDVFALPSKNEGMSNTALEALASGLALVMTPTGGAEELLEDGGNGYVVAPGSARSLATALRGYATRRGLVREHGRRSRRMAQKMSWQRVSRDYLALYRPARPGKAHEEVR